MQATDTAAPAACAQTPHAHATRLTPMQPAAPQKPLTCAAQTPPLPPSARRCAPPGPPSPRPAAASGSRARRWSCAGTQRARWRQRPGFGAAAPEPRAPAVGLLWCCWGRGWFGWVKRGKVVVISAGNASTAELLQSTRSTNLRCGARACDELR